MPTVESVNYEMTKYLQDIEEYIRRYKNLPKKEVRFKPFPRKSTKIRLGRKKSPSEPYVI